jgi:hypothetical protein
MSAFYDQASLVVVPSGYKSGKIYAQKPLTTDGQLTFTRASTATRVNASGLIETVSSGVPRLDYTNSSCPKILLEPQRTNVVTQSLNLSDAAEFNLTKTINNAISPDGTQNAALLSSITGTAGITLATQSFSGNHTVSVYLKGTVAGQKVRVFGDLQSTIADFTLTTSWARYTATFNATNTTGQSIYLLVGSYFSPAQTNNFYAWGAQIEAGAYATSLIPTTSAAVTRLADAASKTGISSLIGQTEGTLFCEFFYNEENKTPNGSDKSVMRVKSGGGYSNEIAILYYGNEGSTYGKTIQSIVTNGGVTQSSLKTTQTMVTGFYKVALAYKANDFALAVNGVIVATDNSGTVPTCDEFSLNEATRVQSDSSQKQVLLFKTRLTNAQLAELTTL